MMVQKHMEAKLGSVLGHFKEDKVEVRHERGRERRENRVVLWSWGISVREYTVKIKEIYIWKFKE